MLGVSLLTALMPRMSRSAAEGRTADVIDDLALGTRLSAVVLLPVSALLTLFGTAVGVALFSLGAGSAGGGAARLGGALAASAFGLLPFAVTMLQLRVFYALTDSRTPTLLQLVIVGVKIPLLLAAPLVLPPDRVVLGLAAANGLSFVVGAVLGQALLHRRLGRLGTAAVLGALIRMRWRPCSPLSRRWESSGWSGLCWAASVRWGGRGWSWASPRWSGGPWWR